jgi:tRNA pseudouridine38-40 synthase
LRYFLEVSYRGTNYHGWQIQNNALSVQQVLEEKLSVLLKSETETIASGRTDTGVHGRQQFVHFDTSGELPPNFLYRLNCILPRDISANSLVPVLPDAHARFDAISREYEYHITTVKNPFLQGLAWEFGKPLDFDLMNKAAEKLLHYDDFECFSKVHTDVATFLCKIEKAEFTKKGTDVIFTIRANRFLRGMVRAIVGTLTDVGLGKLQPDQFESIICSKNRKNAGAQAPPEGLFLTKIAYPPSIFLKNCK